jgi:uncharacterized protein YfaQ (DUF2300 family)
MLGFAALTPTYGGRIRALLFAFAALVFVPSAHAAASSPLHFAQLHDHSPRLWTFNTATLTPGVEEPLPPTLDTPLGSVWKLFIYAYLVDKQLPAPDYPCATGTGEEAYCCTAGGHIDRDRALVKSCGLFFDPHRLQLDPKAWNQYWRALNAPIWLQDINALRPDRRVRVVELLDALRVVPEHARDETASTLVSVITSGRGEGTVSLFGSLLRVKTWTMPTASGEREGGAAGWLADGTPVWIGGRGLSPRVLADAAPRIAPLIARITVPDDRACVVVNFFPRYPILNVRVVPGGHAAPLGALDGKFSISFANVSALPVESHGELRLDQDANGKLHIVGRFGLNDYIARVVEREGDTVEPQAARALAVAARSYLIQNAGRERGCYSIDDSSHAQRVLPRPPRAASRSAADFTDALVLVGVDVQFHFNQAAPGRMSWLAAKTAAQQGQTFDQILARTWPQATLTSFASPLAGDCQVMHDAQDWLRRQAPIWARQLASEAGYEAPEIPAVCDVKAGRPYSDARRNRVYIRGLRSEDDRVALLHEYLHLAFAHHPRGQDERFIEQMARRLVW